MRIIYFISAAVLWCSATGAQAADTVVASNLVLNPNNALDNVAGYASARHPLDVMGGLGLCPSGSTKDGVAATCTANGRTFSYTWELISFDHAAECSSPDFVGADYDVDIQNAQDSCSGGGCSTATDTLIFAGTRSCSFTCTWSWTYQGTLSVPAGQTQTYQFLKLFGTWDGVLLGRSTQVSSVSDPRWVEVEETCVTDP